MKKYIIITVFIFVEMQPFFAQEILIQWTGVVRDELLQPIPYANIIVQRDFRGTVSDNQGMFTIITFPRDTLIISCMGYKPIKISAPNITFSDSKHYIKDIILREDPIMLSEIVIFPWKTYREFKEAFISLELPEDDLQRAYRNISILQEQIYNAINNRQATPNSNFRDAMNSRTNRIMNYGHMYPMYSITNPIAWAQFFQALRNGEFKQKENNEKSPSIFEEILQDNSNR